MRYSARKNQSVFILRVEWTSAFKGFKQQRRRRLQKRHLKSEFAPAASNFIALTPSRLIDQMLADCLELNTKGLYQSSGKEKASCCLVFPSSTKLEITHFHVVVVQWRQRNVQKSVMHVLSFCFDTINLLLFLPFQLPSPSSLLKLPNIHSKELGSILLRHRMNKTSGFSVDTIPGSWISLWRAYSKSFRFTGYVPVDWSRIRKEKSCRLKNIRIRVDEALLFYFFQNDDM